MLTGGGRGQVNTFIMVGHETTAGSLSFTLLELARHPDVQSRLREEIRRVGRDLSYDDIQKLEYLDAVVKEGCVSSPPLFSPALTSHSPTDPQLAPAPRLAPDRARGAPRRRHPAQHAHRRPRDGHVAHLRPHQSRPGLPHPVHDDAPQPRRVGRARRRLRPRALARLALFSLFTLVARCARRAPARLTAYACVHCGMCDGWRVFLCDVGEVALWTSAGLKVSSDQQ